MEKINIAELLKDCPKGMELDCTMFENVTFEEVVTEIDRDGKEDISIIVLTHYNDGMVDEIILTEYGTYTYDETAKCVIFPKGKTTWDGFVQPRKFKDGDILTIGDTIYIYNGIEELFPFPSHYVYVIVDKNGLFAINTSTKSYGTRFATEEEKNILFEAIKNYGYKWNVETKTLETLIEPIFKVGDRIRHKNDKTIIKTIGYIYHDSYVLYDGRLLFFKEQDQYELVPDKFEISRLKPFDKVLVRNSNNGKWCGQFYMAYNKHEDYPFECTYNCWMQCIPYEGNEYLRNTTDACSPFYKIWE